MNPIMYFPIVGILVLSLAAVPIVNKRFDEPLYAMLVAAATVLIPACLVMSWAMTSEYQRIEGTVIEVRPSASVDSSDSLLVKRADGQGMMTPRVDRGSDHPRTGEQVVVVTNQLGLITEVETLQK